MRRHLLMYNKTAKDTYEEKEKSYKEMGWVKTTSCAMSDVFENCDVWAVRGTNQIIIGDRSCYEQAELGFCNTTAGKAVLLDEGEIRGLWYIASYGTDRSVADICNDYHGVDILSEIPWGKLNCFKLKKLPMAGFPYEKYGFKFAEEVA